MSKFKVGDEVRVIKASTNCVGRHCCEKYINDIGIVCSVDSIRIGINKFQKNSGWCTAFNENCIELVCKDEIIYEED